MVKVWKLLSVLIIPLMCLGLVLVPGAVPGQEQVALASGNVTVAIEPATTYALADGNFTIDAVINNPDGNEIAMLNMRLAFNTSYFTVTAVTKGDFPEDMGAAVINNTAGTIQYDPKTAVGTSINGTHLVGAHINCTAKSLEGVSTVSWRYTSGPPPAYTKVIYSSTDYLEGGNMSLMHNGTVIIGPVFNLTVTSNGCCNITVGGLGTVAANSSQSFIVSCPNVTLTANSPGCCNFVNWTVDGNSTLSNPVTVTGAANSTHNATATCSVPQYNLTMAVTGNGTTTPSIGPHTYNCGDVVNITATADSGWQFVNWTTTDMSEIANATAASTTVTVDKNKTVTANFVERFNLTMAVTGNGTTTPAVGNHTYNNGTVVPINATPGSGWHFVNWTTTGNLSEIANATAASTTVTVDKNKTVTATFAINRYNLTINSTIGGNVTIPGEGNFTYDHGTVVNLTATPDADYAFLWWSGNVSTIGDVNSSNTSITMYGNYSIIANFGPHYLSASPIPLTFTATEGENPPAQTLEVCNTGNGTLNWTLTDNAGWLSESPVSGSLNVTECENVTVSVAASSLAAGDYSATITITGSLELEVPVSLHIVSAMPSTPPPAPASISASGLHISPQQVKPGEEVTISINVKNSGEETGSYNAVLYINGAVETSQSVSVAGGASKNVIFTVSKTEPGVYDVSIAGQSGQFTVVHTGWFGGGLGTGGIIVIVVLVIVLILALVFVLRGTRRGI